MKKKIFILTGEPSGDKLSSKAIAKLKELNPNIDYLSVGGEYLNSLSIKSIYDLREITYFGFTNVLLNFFKIRKKINETASKIIEYNPNILFSIDSPDFTLRVAKIVKKKKPSIKTIHYVAPQVWVWRESRVKKIKGFIDHVLLLFNFEKKYFDKESIKSTFVGHPLLVEEDKNNIDLTNLLNVNNKIISLFPGSRLSEVNILLPILIDFIKLSKTKHSEFTYVFHSTKKLKKNINDSLIKSSLTNCEVISDENIKRNVLSKSFFAIAKSGTISLEICNLKVPSFIIYKMNFLNYFIIKMLVKVKYANIINIISNSEVIPELLQSKCTSKNIYNLFKSFIENPSLKEKQITNFQAVLKEIKSEKDTSENVASILNNNLN
jgi:lipid-A-disaccharide synthase